MNSIRCLLLALPLLLAACATPGVNTEYLDDDGYSVKIASGGKANNPDIVRVVYQEQFKNMLLVKREAGSQPNQHPATITPEELGRLLKPLTVRYGKDKPEPLFSDDQPTELTTFATWLSDALTAAGPDQDIVFHLPQTRGLWLLTEKMMLSGRAFVVDGKLNIIVAHVREGYEGQWVRAGVLRKFKPATRATKVLEDRELVARPPVTLAQPGRGDWVQLDLSAVLQRQAAHRDAGAAPRAGDVVQPRSSAAERLQKLQSLKDKGLISDEEYQSKRQQILGDI